jgi:hypothetical protein
VKERYLPHTAVSEAVLHTHDEYGSALGRSNGGAVVPSSEAVLYYGCVGSGDGLGSVHTDSQR